MRVTAGPRPHAPGFSGFPQGNLFPRAPSTGLRTGAQDGAESALHVALPGMMYPEESRSILASDNKHEHDHDHDHDHEHDHDHDHDIESLIEVRSEERRVGKEC